MIFRQMTSRAMTTRTLRKAKRSIFSPRSWVPTRTARAESVSPPRTKNVSIAALALYFSSLLVTRNRAALVVFWSE